MFPFNSVSQNQWEYAVISHPEKEDRFAKTFAAKATMLSLWPCVGCWSGNSLAGGLAWSLSKRWPQVANLQLLHTFFEFRRKGVGSLLCREFLRLAAEAGAEYFRVSSEPQAVPFYESLGIKFLGKQKTAYLAMARIRGEFKDCWYDINDPVIRAAVCKKGKGGCIEIF